MSGLFRRWAFFSAVAVLFFSLLLVACQSLDETITKKDRDIILLMCAMENPNYDMVLVIDVSGSMSKVLPEWKKMAETTVDMAQLGDTLVLLKFDATPKTPIIQKIEKERDKELFKGQVRKTFTTHGWGTDINHAYWLTLKTLKEFNEGRKKSGEPVRLAQVVFISDGDDLPPDKSPFRNPGSAETMELGDLITDAQHLRTINVIPIGMEFKDYVPQTRRIKKEGTTAGDDKVSKELREFMARLENILNRPSSNIKDDQEKIPRAPYQFYIDWLSNRLELQHIKGNYGKKPYLKNYSYNMVSGFRKVNLKDLSARAVYKGSADGKAKEVISLPSTTLTPGMSQPFSAEVKFPKNWSFSPKKYEGELEVVVSGLMEIQCDQSMKPGDSAPTAAPSPSAKGMVYSYPFEPRRMVISISGKLPPAVELFVLTGGGALALLLGLAMFIIKKAFPIVITLKTGDKARAFRVNNGESVTIGGSADFELTGCNEPVATIKREGNSFFLEVKQEGVLAEGIDGQKTGKFELHEGQSFNFNIGGTYQTLQFLAGDQEEAAAPGSEQVDTYTDDEEKGGFSF